jgi:CHAT domain-containing protein
MDGLRRAAGRHPRWISTRLTGDFVWTPLENMHGYGEQRKVPDDIFASANEVLQLAKGSTAPEAQHSVSKAYFLLNDNRRAIDALQRIPTESRTAAVWSDIASANFVRGTDGGGSTERLIEALVDADRALAIDSSLPEAHFNRALIIESIGLRELAADEWRRFISVDASSPWSAEAREHLINLSSPPIAFREQLDRRYASLPTDSVAAADLASRFPQEIRTWGETEILGRWADAELRGDDAAASQHLAVARVAGGLVLRRGEALLSRAVAAIDASQADERRSLAEGHAAFRSGQQAFLKMQPQTAEQLFKSAATSLDRGRSPIALLARYFQANTAYEEGRIDEAADTLGRLRASAPREFPSYRAQLGWELGLCRSARGRYGDAIALFNESLGSFETLQENGNATAMRGILATVYDLIGDASAAWPLRALSLRGLGNTNSARLQSSLSSLAALAILRNDLHGAASLIRLELDSARMSRNDLFIADALLRRAMVLHRLGDRAAADAELAEARTFIDRIADAGYRSQYKAHLFWVEGSLASRPDHAVESLTHAVEYNQFAGRRAFLPGLLVERARAFAASGDYGRAAADADAAIVEIETHRESLPVGERRWGVFHASEDAFSQAIDLALRRDDVSAAFAYSERARARTLLDTFNAMPSAAKVSLAPSVTLVEYHVEVHRIILFVMSASALRFVVVNIDRGMVAADAVKLSNAIATNDERAARDMARRLYRVLIAPAERWIATNDSLVIVPDITVSAIPFAALVTSNQRYLVEQHSLVVAPSAAVYQKLRQEHSESSGNLLIVANATAATRSTLAGAEHESAALQRLYPRATLLSGRAATPEAFARRATGAHAIHFSGHAIASDQTADDTFLVLSDGASGESKLDVKRIASIRLEHAPTVVLAACSTARGRITPLEGTMSAARAFLAAGAQAVVATLWPIDDAAAAAFFTRLHEHLARGERPADALRAVQINCIRLGMPPAMWAAVQDIGS